MVEQTSRPATKVQLPDNEDLGRFLQEEVGRNVCPDGQHPPAVDRVLDGSPEGAGESLGCEDVPESDEDSDGCPPVVSPELHGRESKRKGANRVVSPLPFWLGQASTLIATARASKADSSSSAARSGFATV